MNFDVMIKKSKKLIVLKPMRHLGQIGSIIKVSQGYARNYLLPNQICGIATDEVIKSIKDKKAQLVKDQKVRVAKYQKWIDQNTDLKLVYIREANDTGKLFGSITKNQLIADLHQKYNLDLEFATIQIDNHIKEIGKFNYELLLANELTASFSVSVVRNENELLNKNK